MSNNNQNPHAKRRGRPPLSDRGNMPTDLFKIDKLITKAGPAALQLMINSMVTVNEDGKEIPNVKIAEKVVAIWAQVFKIKADLQKAEKETNSFAGSEPTQTHAKFQMTVVNPTNKAQVSVKAA